MKEEEIEKRILAHVKNSKIPCKEALALAEKEGIPTQKMAKLLTKHNIKITSCQLGCF